MAPRGCRFVAGVFLPRNEVHFVERLKQLERDGVSARYPVLDLALSFLGPKRRRLAVDVGAHVGLWSRWLVQDFGTVHAFEPVEEFAGLFCLNVAARAGCDHWLHREALGEVPAHISMRIYPEDTGRSHVDGPGQVRQLPLDSYGLEQVDLIKIDVEGYELAVLKGARNTIQRNRPIIILEQRGNEIDRYNWPEGEALRFLTTLGMIELGEIHYDKILGWPC